MILPPILDCMCEFLDWLCVMFQSVFEVKVLYVFRGYRGGSPTAVQAWQPCPLWSRPLVTPYYCRIGDLLCFVFTSAYCMFDLSVYYLFLQYFDTVGWVF